MTYHARPDETAEWLNYLQPEGLVVGPNVLREAGRLPERQTPRDTEAAAAALGLDPKAPRDHDRRFVLAEPWPLPQRGAALACGLCCWRAGRPRARSGAGPYGARAGHADRP